MRKKASLVKKIVAASAIPVVFAAILIVAVISVIQWKLSRQALLETARSRAKIIAANSTPSLAFSNAEDANEILLTLSSDPQVTSATLFDQNGAPFASYAIGPQAPPPPEQPEMRDGRVFRSGALVIYEPVQQNELWLGTLFLRFDLEPLYQQLYSFVLTGVVVGICASGIAVGLAYYMQSAISRPILSLTEVARKVTRAKNYSIRAEESGATYAEVHLLNESFNAMLSRIESQDASLRQSELQFRRAISNAPIPIAIHEQSGRILELSRGWQESSGYSLENMPNLFSWIRDRCPADVLERFQAAVAEPKASGESVSIGIGEMEVDAIDGSTKVWQANATNIGLFQDGTSTWLLIAVDLTDRIRDSQALEHRKLELERSNQELDDFAYIASHDMKEPLRGINNNAMFLDEDFREQLGDEGARRLSRMRFLCKRLETLIDDLLYYSRIGRQDLAIQKIDPNKMVADIAQMLETTLEEKNAKILIANTLPPCVCDAVRVQEVFRNLITNAIKYNASEEKIIEVGFLDEKDGRRNVFYVRDNGYGISPEFHDEVFRIFKRLNPEADDTKGTGSGLTFVKKIVERHRGAVWLRSQPGAGSTFYFTLGDRTASRVLQPT